MRRFEKNLNLFEVAPDLVKEWHPTANGSLTPRNVKISCRKMVWWICNQGHEWEATIKNRINRDGCPHCGEGIEKNLRSHNRPAPRQKISKISNKKSISEQSIFLDIDSFDPSLGRDFRKTKRFKTATTVTIEIPSTGHWFYAGLKNFSSGGMYFETDASIRSGTNIEINLDRPLFQSDQKKYNSIVRWCRKLEADDKEQFNFGIGSKFI